MSKSVIAFFIAFCLFFYSFIVGSIVRNYYIKHIRIIEINETDNSIIIQWDNDYHCYIVD